MSYARHHCKQRHRGLVFLLRAFGRTIYLNIITIATAICFGLQKHRHFIFMLIDCVVRTTDDCLYYSTNPRYRSTNSGEHYIQNTQLFFQIITSLLHSVILTLIWSDVSLHIYLNIIIMGFIFSYSQTHWIMHVCLISWLFTINFN